MPTSRYIEEEAADDDDTADGESVYESASECNDSDEDEDEDESQSEKRSNKRKRTVVSSSSEADSAGEESGRSSGEDESEKEEGGSAGDEDVEIEDVTVTVAVPKTKQKKLAAKKRTKLAQELKPKQALTKGQVQKQKQAKQTTLSMVKAPSALPSDNGSKLTVTAPSAARLVPAPAPATTLVGPSITLMPSKLSRTTTEGGGGGGGGGKGGKDNVGKKLPPKEEPLPEPVYDDSKVPVLPDATSLHGALRAEAEKVGGSTGAVQEGEGGSVCAEFVLPYAAVLLQMLKLSVVLGLPTVALHFHVNCVMPLRDLTGRLLPESAFLKGFTGVRLYGMNSSLTSGFVVLIPATRGVISERTAVPQVIRGTPSGGTHCVWQLGTEDALKMVSGAVKQHQQGGKGGGSLSSGGIQDGPEAVAAHADSGIILRVVSNPRMLLEIKHVHDVVFGSGARTLNSIQDRRFLCTLQESAVDQSTVGSPRVVPRDQRVFTVPAGEFVGAAVDSFDSKQTENVRIRVTEVVGPAALPEHILIGLKIESDAVNALITLTRYSCLRRGSDGVFTLDNGVQESVFRRIPRDAARAVATSAYKSKEWLSYLKWAAQTVTLLHGHIPSGDSTPYVGVETLVGGALLSVLICAVRVDD